MGILQSAPEAPAGMVLDLSRFPGAYYYAGDAGGGSEGAAPSPAGYYLPGGYGGDGYVGPQYLGDDVYRPATWRDYDWNLLGDPGSPVRQRVLKIDPYWYGRTITLFGSTPYTITGPDDPVMLSMSLLGLLPRDQWQSVLGNTRYAPLITMMDQLDRANRDFNAASAHDSTILGLPTPFVLALAALGGAAFLGVAGAGIETAGGATGALGTAEAVGGGGALLSEGGAVSLGVGAVTDAGLPSLVGPATGTVLEPGLQASGAFVAPIESAGLPVLSGVVEGAAPFAGLVGDLEPFPRLLDPGLPAGDLEQFPQVLDPGAPSLVGPPTGTVLEPGLQASGAVVTPIESAGLPVVTGVAAGAGAFLPPALADLGGADLIDKGIAAVKAGGAQLVKQILAPSPKSQQTAQQPAPASASPGAALPDPMTLILAAAVALVAFWR